MPIEAVDSTTSGQRVRVRGVVSRYPDYDRLAERLTFWLDDGTGKLLVALDQSRAQGAFDRGEALTIGDRVTAAGTIGVRMAGTEGTLVYLTVAASEDLELEHPVPVDSAIDAAAAEPLYTSVLVKGQVSEVLQPYEGLTILRIEDGTGEIDVLYDRYFVGIGGAPTTVYRGDLVSVRGIVTEHRGQARLVLAAASGLQRLPALAQQLTAVYATEMPRGPTATVAIGLQTPTSTAVAVQVRPTPTAWPSPPPMTATREPVTRGETAQEAPLATAEPLVRTGQLSELHLGSTVVVEGRIVRATLLSAGCKSVLDDGSGPAVIWMPNALYEQLVDPAGWNVGGVARVTGGVEEYEGELEVVPQGLGGLVMVQRAVLAASPDAAIGNLSIADLERRVTVEGTIVDVEPFSAGVKCLLEDAGARVTLLLWQNVFEAIPDRESLVAETRLRVTGWVDEYRGELEIVPGVVYDVVVVGAANAP
jgi:DNA/RNA endonuclease YhcR with UshA esterase domain